MKLARLIFVICWCCCFAQAKQPNLMIILMDDMNMNLIHRYGNEMIQTPNMDRLVDEGVSFMNAYNMGSWSAAVCIPSRTMLNTGLKLWSVHEKLNNFDQPLLSQRLQAAGYATYFTGKWHCEAGVTPEEAFEHVGRETPGQPPRNEVEGPFIGWDKRRGGYWVEDGHLTDLVADNVVKFIKQAAEGEQPFFLYAGFNAPHVPRQAPKKYFDMYPVDQIELPPSYLLESEDVEMKWVKKVWPNIYRDRYQENYAMLTHFDDNLARILETLESSGVAENTILIFMSDHGTNLGENGVVGKENLYDLSMSAPLILRGPGMPAGKRIDSRVYLQDVMPTLLKLGNADVPDYVEFESLLPLIMGRTAATHQAIYGGFKDTMRCVVKDDFKLIRYYKPEGVVDRLYDLNKDPAEIVDLAKNLEYRDRLQKLRAQLIKSAEEHADPMESI